MTASTETITSQAGFVPHVSPAAVGGALIVAGSAGTASGSGDGISAGASFATCGAGACSGGAGTGVCDLKLKPHSSQKSPPSANRGVWQIGQLPLNAVAEDSVPASLRGEAVISTPHTLQKSAVSLS
jgi:hypothetical protein